MLVLDYKVSATRRKPTAIDEAIRTVQFMRNKGLRLWMDGRGIGDSDLQAYCSELAKDYPFAARLNSLARQAAADRAWLAIARFYKNCREKKPGKKGYPRSRRTIEALNTKPRDGSWSRMATDHLHRWHGHRHTADDWR